MKKEYEDLVILSRNEGWILELEATIGENRDVLGKLTVYKDTIDWELDDNPVKKSKVDIDVGDEKELKELIKIIPFCHKVWVDRFFSPNRHDFWSRKTYDEKDEVIQALSELLDEYEESNYRWCRY